MTAQVDDSRYSVVDAVVDLRSDLSDLPKPRSGGCRPLTPKRRWSRRPDSSPRPSSCNSGSWPTLRISAAEARRLACRAGVIPVVLGGKSQPLDIGRQGRFHTKPQRIALGLRDGGCSTVGCDRPPAMCHAHHDIPWSHGGRTSVEDGRLLCSRHHTLAHDPAYATTIQPDNKVTFHRRC